MTTSRIPQLSGNDLDAVVSWFHALSSNGLLFHPDDDPGDVVEIASGVRLFSDDEVTQLREIMTALFDQHGDRVYEAALPAFNDVRKDFIREIAMRKVEVLNLSVAEKYWHIEDSDLAKMMREYYENAVVQMRDRKVCAKMK